MTLSVRERIAQHKNIVVQQLPDTDLVAIRLTDLKELWELAHEAVHPPEDEDDTSIELGYDEMSLRMQSLHLATNVDLARMHASDGGTWNSDPIGLAEVYLAFLKGGDEGDASDLGSV